MIVEETTLKGVLILKPRVFKDSRGFFLESFNKKTFESATGLKKVNFVQDNHSRSEKSVLRGLHFQIKHCQSKLVRVTKGEIFDVVVDIRDGSDTFGESFSLILSEENKYQLWIPIGFAHGFQVKSDFSDVLYKTTDYWHEEHEQVLSWDDPDLGIDWPIDHPKVSERDNEGKLLSELEKMEFK